MEISSIESFTRLLQLSVVPVVLISGVGLLLLSFTNRLGRTVDRSRILARELASGVLDDRTAAIDQLQILVRRSELLRSSITFVALSIFFSSAMIIGLFLRLFIGWSTERVVLILFFVSVLALIISVVFFLMDIFLSLKALRLEVGKHLKGHP